MAKFKNLIYETLLREKQILFGDGANYNQAVFLAGGTASGKSFASKHFMEGEKFRHFDVDRWKEGFLKLQDELNKYPELADLDLQDPDDVSKLHRFVKDKGIHNQFIENVVFDSQPGRLPNVLFDVTLRKVNKLHRFLPILHEAGYVPRNIHLVWVLTDYEIAVQRNRSRERIVPEDILIQTHEGAATTVTGLAGEGLPKGMNGAVHVVLNNPEHTVVFTDENGNEIETDAEQPVIRDFTYVTLKESGQPFRDSLEIRETIAQWIKTERSENNENTESSDDDGPVSRERWIEMMNNTDSLHKYVKKRNQTHE